jgi:hypothetical protein
MILFLKKIWVHKKRLLTTKIIPLRKNLIKLLILLNLREIISIFKMKKKKTLVISKFQIWIIKKFLYKKNKPGENQHQEITLYILVKGKIFLKKNCSFNIHWVQKEFRNLMSLVI